MIDAKLPSALKKVHKPANSRAMQKNKAKVHKVHKNPAQAQALGSCPEMDDVIQEDQEEEQQEEQQEEQEGECQEDEGETARKDEPQIGQKEYYRFWKKLPEAPKAVQEAVQKVKDQPHRSGKQKQLAQMAKAYASQKWGHKLFNSIESLMQTTGLRALFLSWTFLWPLTHTILLTIPSHLRPLLIRVPTLTMSSRVLHQQI